ncbi:hypothetical protein LZZ85_18690 [Terrimonas sp. NA20]|uniref:Uncharacterized protein n=1 Tax=Terrimonas ginsenosidimutans TaxID=2908004 RepID=A0ABS9KVE3_9BACT|nr:hypothetical protein [Terrimonas ginsenosidimutans]MCG2616334.1 hypothetical protein [Terrimonas ginsenosidimutans]
MLSCKQKAGPVLAAEYLHHEDGMQVITSLINNKNKTISIIYGNQLAAAFAGNVQREHQAGEKYVMVTSDQRPMPHWYGTNMNGAILCVEYATAVVTEEGGVGFDYMRRSGNGKLMTEGVDETSRIRFMTGQPAAVHP